MHWFGRQSTSGTLHPVQSQQRWELAHRDSGDGPSDQVKDKVRANLVLWSTWRKLPSQMPGSWWVPAPTSEERSGKPMDGTSMASKECLFNGTTLKSSWMSAPLGLSIEHWWITLSDLAWLLRTTLCFLIKDEWAMNWTLQDYLPSDTEIKCDSAKGLCIPNRKEKIAIGWNSQSIQNSKKS